jgi:hypothetical protein
LRVLDLHRSAAKFTLFVRIFYYLDCSTKRAYKLVNFGAYPMTLASTLYTDSLLLQHT